MLDGRADGLLFLVGEVVLSAAARQAEQQSTSKRRSTYEHEY